MTIEEFAAATAKGLVLVDFIGETCSACRAMAPIVEAVKNETGLTLLKLDAMQERELSIKYSVQSLPTMLIFKDGELKKQFVGMTSKVKLLDAIKNA